jgi:hypothetical protein
MKTKPPFKIELCLTELINRTENGLNQLEAFAAYGETALHSTISALANDHGLLIKRVREPHIHRHGTLTHFHRYSLSSIDSMAHAKHLVAAYAKHRGVA